MAENTTIRTFIAIDIPQSIKSEIRLVQVRLRNVPGSRITWTKPAGIHLTLKFLGDVEKDRISDVIDAVSGGIAGSGVLSLRTTELGGFPNLGKPRVLWVGVDGSRELISIQESIDRRLAKLGFPREKKRFHPHLTVGRVKSLERNSELPGKYREFEFPAIDWTAEEVLVMSSVLKPSGAEYSVIAACQL